jgi:hypothetical protein
MHTALQPWSSQQKLDLQNIHHIQTEKQALLLTYVLNMKLSYMYNKFPGFSIPSQFKDGMLTPPVNFSYWVPITFMLWSGTMNFPRTSVY